MACKRDQVLVIMDNLHEYLSSSGAKLTGGLHLRSCIVCSIRTGGNAAAPLINYYHDIIVSSETQRTRIVLVKRDVFRVRDASHLKRLCNQ